MRILPVSNFSFQKTVRRQDRQERFFVGNRNNTDTVSLTGGNKMADCVEHSVSKNMDRLTRIETGTIRIRFLLPAGIKWPTV